MTVCDIVQNRVFVKRGPRAHEGFKTVPLLLSFPFLFLFHPLAVSPHPSDVAPQPGTLRPGLGGSQPTRGPGGQSTDCYVSHQALLKDCPSARI